MTTCYWCRHVGGEGCDPMGSAVQVQVLVLCTFSTDPGRINIRGINDGQDGSRGKNQVMVTNFYI